MEGDAGRGRQRSDAPDEDRVLAALERTGTRVRARRRRHRAALPRRSAARASLPRAGSHRTEDRCARTSLRDAGARHLRSAPASDRVDRDDLALGRTSRQDLPRAIERAIDVSFDDFQGEVGAFLEPEHAAIYSSRDAWNQMQAEVVAALEALA